MTTDSESISLGDGTTPSIVDTTDVSPDSAFGFCLDYEARLTDRFGLDLYAGPFPGHVTFGVGYRF